MLVNKVPTLDAAMSEERRARIEAFLRASHEPPIAQRRRSRPRRHLRPAAGTSLSVAGQA
jgi:hypothetical protein